MKAAEIPIERQRLETLVRFGEKRVGRAWARCASADQEVGAATEALEVAKARLAAWHAANPDPQLRLTEIINPEGEEK